MFSIKQAGVPLGGVIAGLAIPPLIEAFGWRTALVIAAAGAIAATVLMLPFRKRIEAPREPRAGAAGIRIDLAVPLRALTSAPGLPRIAGVGVALSRHRNRRGSPSRWPISSSATAIRSPSRAWCSR